MQLEWKFEENGGSQKKTADDSSQPWYLRLVGFSVAGMHLHTADFILSISTGVLTTY